MKPFGPFQKIKPVRSEAYRRAVAALPCWRCGVHGYSNAAHADEGKGMGLKTSDLTCYPLCVPRVGVAGCHADMGASGNVSRQQRREFEKVAAAETIAKLITQAMSDNKLHRVLVKLEVMT